MEHNGRAVTLIENPSAATSSLFEPGFFNPVKSNGAQRTIEDVIVSRSREVKAGKLVMHALVNGFRHGKVVAEHVAEGLVREIFDNAALSLVDFDDSTVDDMDNLIKQLVVTGFQRVDEDYFKSKIDHLLAERFQQQAAVGTEMTLESNEQLSETESKIAGGAVVVVALQIRDRLYIANCGNSIAVFVEADNKQITIRELSQLHEAHEPKEITRLAAAGVDPRQVFGPSRCFGDYFRKRGFEDMYAFHNAKTEFVCVEPNVSKGITVTTESCFLLLLSPSVAQAMMQLETAKRVCESISLYIIEKICASNSTENIAQVVVDWIAKDLQVKVDLKQIKPLENSLSLIFIPIANNIPQMVLKPSDGDLEIQVASKYGQADSVPCYVDFSEYFSLTPEGEDMRNDIKGKVESIKTMYKANNSLAAIRE